MINRREKSTNSQTRWQLLTVTAAIALLGWQIPSHAQIATDKHQKISQIEQTENNLSRRILVNVRLRHILKGHTTPVRSLLFSNDSNILISGGGTNEPFLKFWSVNKGNEIDSLRSQSSAILALTMSPNGKTLISSGEDTDIHFWRWPEPASKITFFDHYYYVLSLVVTPDSQLLVSGALDGIRVWTIDPPHFLYQLSGFGTRAYSLAMHPNGYLVASGDDQGKVKFWNLRERILVSEFSAHEKPVSGLAVTPDSKTLITGSYDGTVKIWDIATGKLLHTLRRHKGRIEKIALSPDGQIVASASNDGVRLWNVQSGRMLKHLTRHEDWVNSLAFSPDGRFLASGGLDRTIYLWEISPYFFNGSPSSVKP
ncbi:MAG TPA: WD40 repeat domain-containing protein [Cyanothece sp. UBA12306]|nr:WD40 repeat domain-containing protein [Cyanothece sp. UBA12306]